MKKLFNPLLFVLCISIEIVEAQEPVAPPIPAYVNLTDVQLDQILGPIALYPDPLIAQILPASTLPTEIVLADRFIIAGGDPNQLSQQPWDPSVQAVAHYPTVLKSMDDNLSVTTQLGLAFLNQQPAVMASIQRLRAEASRLGNLSTTSQEQVTNDGTDIEIDPTDDQQIYVPVYQTNQVYADQAGSSSYITYSSGYRNGEWMDNDFDWGNNGVIIVWGSGNRRPVNWWHETRDQRSHGNVQATTWQPSTRIAQVRVDGGDRGRGNTAVTSPTNPTLINGQNKPDTQTTNLRPVTQTEQTPRSPQLEVVKPEAPKPEVKPQTPKPEVVKPEAPKPEVKPQTPKPEVVKPEAPKPEVKPQTPKPEVAKPEAPKPEVKPQNPKPEVSKPKPLAPKPEDSKPKPTP